MDDRKQYDLHEHYLKTEDGTKSAGGRAAGGVDRNAVPNVADKKRVGTATSQRCPMIIA